MVTEPHAETEKSGPGDGELCFSQVSQVKTNDFWKVGTFLATLVGSLFFHTTSFSRLFDINLFFYVVLFCSFCYYLFVV